MSRSKLETIVYYFVECNREIFVARRIYRWMNQGLKIKIVQKNGDLL